MDITFYICGIWMGENAALFIHILDCRSFLLRSWVHHKKSNTSSSRFFGLARTCMNFISHEAEIDWAKLHLILCDYWVALHNGFLR